ncbi:hypothetical protein VFPPC_18027 [Pochonia chlamydosporia 170]|uniref:Uncharacterized protein n=1 Tax=Pochonia chlamydosporia 170 TaxID=1380566 RepID=A0A219AQB1_METCM|nr:hypothetical protein VFPPC_18027 [Pochonia chlamydosporia 170]OWT42772.1 hypothetical protein VFPPC_18027 [Pochonia chlamydosporia 170]
MVDTKWPPGCFHGPVIPGRFSFAHRTFDRCSNRCALLCLALQRAHSPSHVLARFIAYYFHLLESQSRSEPSLRVLDKREKHVQETSCLPNRLVLPFLSTKAQNTQLPAALNQSCSASQGFSESDLTRQSLHPRSQAISCEARSLAASALVPSFSSPRN